MADRPGQTAAVEKSGRRWNIGRAGSCVEDPGAASNKKENWNARNHFRSHWTANWKTDDGPRAVGRTDPSGTYLSVRRWNEAGAADRGDDQADTTSRLVPERYRGVRDSRRRRPDPARSAPNSEGPDAACCRRARNHHDRGERYHDTNGGLCARTVSDG